MSATFDWAAMRPEDRIIQFSREPTNELAQSLKEGEYRVGSRIDRLDH
jgi:hypothetical protein